MTSSSEQSERLPISLPDSVGERFKQIWKEESARVTGGIRGCENAWVLSEDELLRAMHRVREETIACQWQDIETAPRDGRRFLTYRPVGSGIEIGCFWEGYWQDDTGEVVTPPTHWMPLPTPPQKDLESR